MRAELYPLQVLGCGSRRLAGGEVRCRERLGGILKGYDRGAPEPLVC